MTAYRWNASSVSLRWLPPALPGGPLGNYSVRAAGQSHQVEPGSRCAAWPEHVCHTVHTAGSQLQVQVQVVASSMPGQLQGDLATVSVHTAQGGT